MIQVKNTQKIYRLNKKEIIQLTQTVLNYLGKSRENVSLLFCDNRTIKKINRQYLGRNRTTDVISFYLKDEFYPRLLGEVIVSVEEAKQNSRIYKTKIIREIRLYVIHGLLHLAGYQDYTKKQQQQMQAAEHKLLNYFRKKKQGK